MQLPSNCCIIFTIIIITKKMNQPPIQPMQQPQLAQQTTPQQQEKKSGCGKWLFLVILLGGIIGLLSLICFGGIYLLTKDRDIDNPKTTETTTVSGSKEDNPNNFNTVNVKTGVESINNDNITVVKAERIKLNELILGHEALKLLVNTNWSGDKDDDLPISSKDFSQSELTRIIEHEKDKLVSLEIPDEFDYLFHTSQGVSDVNAEMMSARQEYLDYLKAKGVAQKYIDEINNNALPADSSRMTYHPDNNPDSPPSVTQKYSGSGSDYSQREFNLYDIDIYNDITIFERSKILGDAPASGYEREDYYRTLRNMGIRILMYHEMTHVLQRAYISLNVDPSHKGDKVAWVYADKTLMDVDNQYFWEWGGGSLKNENNLDVSQESQSEGISFEILTNVYDMSDKQKEALWDHIHGRLDDARVHLNAIKNLSESNYPNYSPDALGGMLAEAFSDYPNLTDRGILQRTSRKLMALAPYVGYLNAMRPEDTHLFWDALKN